MRKIDRIFAMRNYSLSNKPKTFSDNYNKYLHNNDISLFFIYKDFGVDLVANQCLKGGQSNKTANLQ